MRICSPSLFPEMKPKLEISHLAASTRIYLRENWYRIPYHYRTQQIGKFTSNLCLSSKDSMKMTTTIRGKNSGSGYTGLIYTSYPGIILPFDLAQSLIGEIHPNRSDCTYSPVVDCDRVESLPSLQIGLNGQKVTLSGEDYVFKWTTPDGACPIPIEECVLYIDSLPPPGGRDEFPEDLIILGTSFLKKVYSVYNWDEQTISCRLKAAIDQIMIDELTWM
jgi:hypothetical protein